MAQLGPCACGAFVERRSLQEPLRGAAAGGSSWRGQRGLSGAKTWWKDGRYLVGKIIRMIMTPKAKADASTCFNTKTGGSIDAPC